jgi:hypothetical protein
MSFTCPLVRDFFLSFLSNKRDRDVALRSRLAYVTLAGRPFGALTQDEPLSGGYSGTALTASLSHEAHFFWAKSQIIQIGRALGRTHLPPHIQQHLLLYGANAKISHTHCRMALFPQAIREVDSKLGRAYLDKSGNCPQPFSGHGYTPS